MCARVPAGVVSRSKDDPSLEPPQPSEPCPAVSHFPLVSSRSLPVSDKLSAATLTPHSLLAPRPVIFLNFLNCCLSLCQQALLLLLRPFPSYPPVLFSSFSEPFLLTLQFSYSSLLTHANMCIPYLGHFYFCIDTHLIT